MKKCKRHLEKIKSYKYPRCKEKYLQKHFGISSGVVLTPELLIETIFRVKESQDEG